MQNVAMHTWEPSPSFKSKTKFSAYKYVSRLVCDIKEVTSDPREQFARRYERSHSRRPVSVLFANSPRSVSQSS